MATSGTYSFNETRDEIIHRALRKLGAIDQSTSLGSSDDKLLNAVKQLNAMIRSWRAESIHLWNAERISQPLVASSLVVGTDGKDYRCIQAHTSGTTSKPITGTNWTSFWVDAQSTGLGSAWVTSTGYTAINQFSLDSKVIGIDYAFFRTATIDTPLFQYTRRGYFEIGSKFTLGAPTGFLFERKLGSPLVTLYPVPSATSDVIHMDVIVKTMDAGAGTDNPDFPEEWLDAIALGLAVRLASDYNIQPLKWQMLQKDALEAKRLARGLDSEQMDLVFIPDLRR